MKKVIVACLLSQFVALLMYGGTSHAFAASARDEVIITVKSSPSAEYATSVRIQSRKMIKGVVRSRQTDVSEHGIPGMDTSLTLRRNGETTYFTVSEDGTLFERKRNKKWTPPTYVKQELQQIVPALRTKHYGEMIPWAQVDKVFPKKARAQIMDLETGLTFNVQRRAGAKHADVQPLSFRDTKIMKRIYNGKWSWNRRAILVKTGDRVIAASMHGMPHGKGALTNGFPGHFCVHFFESTTHRSKNVDLFHHLMIYKAAGRQDEYFKQLTPYGLIDVFLAAYNQQDRHLLGLTVSGNEPMRPNDLFGPMDNIVSVTRHSSFTETEVSPLPIVRIPVEVRIYTEGRGEERESVAFVVVHHLLRQRWEIVSCTRSSSVHN